MPYAIKVANAKDTYIIQAHVAQKSIKTFTNAVYMLENIPEIKLVKVHAFGGVTPKAYKPEKKVTVFAKNTCECGEEEEPHKFKNELILQSEDKIDQLILYCYY